MAAMVKTFLKNMMFGVEKGVTEREEPVKGCDVVVEEDLCFVEDKKEE